MKHYIDTNNKIWGFDDSQSALIPAGAVYIPLNYNSDEYPFLTLVNGVIHLHRNEYTAYLEAKALSACKTQAQALLSATDWVTLSDVTAGSPKLVNQAEFLTYRSAVRALAVNPVESPTWPTLPKEQWM
jgi:hypothetical protein